MSTQFEFAFHTTVLPDGTLADPIPAEMYGDEVLLVPVRKKPPLPKDNSPENNPFFRKLTLDEIVAEQGGSKVCTDPKRLSWGGPQIWDTQEEMEEFLEQRKSSLNETAFWQKKSLDEIVAEQGGPKICTDPDKLFGCLAFLWDSPEDVEDFLQRRKEDI